MSAYLQYVCSQIMKYRHTKQPQTYYTERNHAADRKTKKGPCPFVFFFFSLVYINKAEKTDTHFHLPNTSRKLFKDGHIYTRQRPTYLKFPYSNIKTTVPQFTAAVK